MPAWLVVFGAASATPVQFGERDICFPVRVDEAQRRLRSNQPPSSGRSETPHAVGVAARVDPRKSLLITDLSVVNDPGRTFDASIPHGNPDGKWAFGRLMKEVANTPTTMLNAADLVRNWLELWRRDVTINGDIVRGRPEVTGRIFAAWRSFSRAAGAADLDVRYAPFRLLAIVNRIDLRDPRAAGDAGEARFVFTAMATDGSPLDFVIILEYRVRVPTRDGVREWARRWYDLKGLAFGAGYLNPVLEQLTDAFSLANTARDRRPNLSALAQLRTNERLGNAPYWELREFSLGTRGYLVPATVGQTPAARHNSSELLGDFINANADQIVRNDYSIPPTHGGRSFLGGAAPQRFGTPNARGFWDAPRVMDAKAVEAFALHTCNGCHHRETSNYSAEVFRHIRGRRFAEEATLSSFLTGFDDAGRGVTVIDPRTGLPKPAFRDLRRRCSDLDQLVNEPIELETTSARLTAVH
jgi:hypothetical protein